MDYRYLARVVAIARIGIGGALVASPQRLAQQIVGSAATGPAVGVLTRAMGVRDLVIGTGTVAALGATDAGADAKRWVNLSAVCDAADAVAMLAAFGSLPRGRRTLVLGLAAGAAALGARASQDID